MDVWLPLLVLTDTVSFDIITLKAGTMTDEMSKHDSIVCLHCDWRFLCAGQVTQNIDAQNQMHLMCIITKNQ